MLHFSAFYPFDSFLRVEQEFGDESFTREARSLRVEAKREIPYTEIAIISFRRQADIQALNTAYGIAVFTSVLIILIQNPLVLAFGPYFLLAALAIWIVGMFQREYCDFYSKEREHLGQIRLTAKNVEAVHQAIELVRSKTGITEVSHADNPFPDEAANFELLVHFYPPYFSKNIIRFYKQRVVDYTTSMLGSYVMVTTYADLTGKVDLVKETDDSWSTTSWLVLFTGIVLWAVFYGILHFRGPLEFEVFIALMVLSALLFLRGYFKDRLVVFQGTHVPAAIVSRIPRSQQPKIEEIIQFVKSKVSASTPASDPPSSNP